MNRVPSNLLFDQLGLPKPSGTIHSFSAFPPAATLTIFEVANGWKVQAGDGKEFVFNSKRSLMKFVNTLLFGDPDDLKK